jgi:sigma-B regulation protein RsbU (phosphoserine phosphatase)
VTEHEIDGRLRAIAAVTDTTIRHLGVDDLLDELLGRVADLLSADTAAVLLLDSSGTRLEARAAFGIEEEVRQGVRVPLGAGFAGRIAAERRPVQLDVVDPTTVWNPILWEKGIVKMLGVPLESGAHLLGVLHVGRVAGVPFTEDDGVLLGLVATRVAAAVQARQLEIERAAGRVVQRSLLPSALPTISGIEFATRFVPAEEGGVGGDWYDAFILPNDEVWVMVGDVAGHGLEAAITMGRLRAALRSYALDGNAPAKVLVRTDRKFQMFDPDQMATVICARLKPPYDRLEIASAGHPSPVLATPGQPTTLLNIPTVPPLGTALSEPKAAAVQLPPGGLLLLYTDGLIERRGESLDEGLERLVSTVTADDPESVCRRVMADLVGLQTPRDDIAVLALHRVGPTPISISEA